MKVYGLLGTATDVFKVQYRAGEKKVFRIPITDASDGSDSEDSCTVIESDDEGGKKNYTFRPNSTKEYTYSLEGITEGNGTYDVDIVFDSDYTYTDKNDTTLNVNDQLEYIYSAFDDETAFFINPISGDVYYDEDAINFFVQANREYMDTLYNEEKARVDSHNAEIRQQAHDAGEDPDLPKYTSQMWSQPPRTDYPNASVSTVIGAIHRDLYITIDYNDSPLTTDRFKVSSKMIYYIPYNHNDSVKPKDNPADIVGQEVDEDGTTHDRTFPGAGYCTDVAYDNTDIDIYMFYIPYPYMSTTDFAASPENPFQKLLTNAGIAVNLADSTTNGCQKVYVQNNVAEMHADVFLAVQGKTNNFTGDLQTVSTHAVGAGTNDLFSNVGLSSGKSATNSSYLLLQGAGEGGSTTHSEKVLAVTINVYEKKEDGTKELLRTRTSTIVD